MVCSVPEDKRTYTNRKRFVQYQKTKEPTKTEEVCSVSEDQRTNICRWFVQYHKTREPAEA
jgi:hypothetical protein